MTSLRDDPVDNINQPLLAAALIEPGTGRTHSAVNAYGTNFGICATVDGKW